MFFSVWNIFNHLRVGVSKIKINLIEYTLLEEPMHVKAMQTALFLRDKLYKA